MNDRQEHIARLIISIAVVCSAGGVYLFGDGEPIIIVLRAIFLMLLAIYMKPERME